MPIFKNFEKGVLTALKECSTTIQFGEGSSYITDVILYGEEDGDYLTWDASENTLVMSADHFYIETDTDTKSLRLQFRDYPSTSGDFNAVSIKPNLSVTGTATLKGLEVSPRFADAVGGNTLIGVCTDLILKGDSGTLSGAMRCYQAQMTDENSAGRTVTGVASCYDGWHQLAGHTFTAGVFFLSCRTAGGATPWKGLIWAQASGAGGVVVSSDGMYRDPQDHAEAGYIDIYVGTTCYEVPFYASS